MYVCVYVLWHSIFPACTQRSDAQRTLFAATKVLQNKPREAGAKVCAVVVRTGFSTAKGALILSILYPRPSYFNFLQVS